MPEKARPVGAEPSCLTVTEPDFEPPGPTAVQVSVLIASLVSVVGPQPFWVSLVVVVGSGKDRRFPLRVRFDYFFVNDDGYWITKSAVGERQVVVPAIHIVQRDGYGDPNGRLMSRE